MLATRVGGLTRQLAGEPLARLAAPEPSSLAECLARLAREPLPPAPPHPTHNAAHDAAWSALAASLLAELEPGLPGRPGSSRPGTARCARPA